MKFLVTGANGFVGKALSTELLRQGYDVRATHRSTKSLAENIVLADSSRIPVLTGMKREEIVTGVIDSETDWTNALRGVNVVIHLAARVHVMHDKAENPLEAFLAVNLDGTVNLANAAAKTGVKRFVYVSSIKVNSEYTENRPFTEEDIPNPQDPYAVSKWQAEQALHKIAEETGMEVVIVRPPLVYGPGVKANFISLLNIVDKKLPLPLPFGRISNARSMIYVGNLVDALITCATHVDAAGQTYLVCDNEDVSTPQLINKLAFALKRPCLVFPFPLSIMRFLARLAGKSSAVDRLTQSLVIDCSTICNELGWEPPFTMQEGLLKTAQWYVESVKK